MKVAQLLSRGESVETTFHVLHYIVWTHESPLIVMAARELLRAKTMQELSVAVDRERWRAEDEAYVPPKRYEYVDSGFGVFVDAR